MEDLAVHMPLALSPISPSEFGGLGPGANLGGVAIAELLLREFSPHNDVFLCPNEESSRLDSELPR